jgi:OFA family oxalate/formate antiporter-like MFS transporter
MSGQFKAQPNQGFLYNPWVQLFSGVMCMMMIANLQYGWTLFVNPIAQKFGWERAAIQITFTIFVFLETWLTPIEAYFVDKYGPRSVVIFGSFMITASWVLNSYADSLALFYISAAIGATGAAAVYGTSVGNALKWFPYRRGLAAGITAAGFGAGAAVTVVPIQAMIGSGGFQNAFFYFGIGQGAVTLFFAFWLRKAPKVKVASTNKRASARDFRPSEVLRSKLFWMIYPLFVLIAAAGINLAAQLAPMAKDFGLTGASVTLIGLTLPALTFALSLDRVLDGCGRPLFGFISDRIGREQTMGITFGFAAVVLFLMVPYGHTPVGFVLLTALYFAVFGEIYSLFPSTCGDTYGSGYAASNAGMLYTAKGTAAIGVPIFAVIAAQYGWETVFIVSAVINLTGAVYAVTILRPARLKHIAATHVEAALAAAAAALTTGAKTDDSEKLVNA